MENQHRQIKGYRELSQEEIDAMNRIKEQGAVVGTLIEEVSKGVMVRGETGEETQVVPDGRWLAIARTHLQEGFMALTRSVTKPDFF